MFRAFREFQNVLRVSVMLFYNVVPWQTMTVRKDTDDLCEIFELWPFGELQRAMAIWRATESYGRLKSYREAVCRGEFFLKPLSFHDQNRRLMHKLYPWLCALVWPSLVYWPVWPV